MSQEKMQNFENHARFVPAFHFFIAPVLMINFIWSLVQLRNGFGFASAMNVLVAAALLTLAFVARLFALAVQDRVAAREPEMARHGIDVPRGVAFEPPPLEEEGEGRADGGVVLRDQN